MLPSRGYDDGPGPAARRDEFVCHRDDDARNNWPENLYPVIHSSTQPTACGTGDV